MHLTLTPQVKIFFRDDQDLFDQVMSLRGEVFRDLEGRRTQRVILGKKSYFVKQHFGIGWKEIFKNLLQLRLPVLGAKNEWLALQRLHDLGVPTMQVAGYGCRGFNPATRQSFLLTEELTQIISLEDFCKNWQVSPPPAGLKHALIREVARIARILHENGINHRDFYICHFLLSTSSPMMYPTLYLIDLHRAQIRSGTPERWIIKDLAGLYFSSKDIGLTSRDLWRFIREYRKRPLRDVLAEERTFWQKVKARGNRTYREHGN